MGQPSLRKVLAYVGISVMECRLENCINPSHPEEVTSEVAWLLNLLPVSFSALRRQAPAAPFPLYLRSKL